MTTSPQSTRKAYDPLVSGVGADVGLSRHSRARGVTCYVVKRVGQALVVVFGAITVSFWLVHATGNPATVLAGGSLPPATIQALSVKLGYNRPVLQQYGSYILNVLHGQFGTSFRYDAPALNSVFSALPYTLLLVVIALSCSMAIAILLATFMVIGERGWAERVMRPVVYALQGLPDFWIAVLLVLVFSVHLGLLPSIEFNGPSSLIMPCAALTVPLLAQFTRMLRGSLLDFTNSDVAFALQARGLSRREIVLHHSFKNAMAAFVPFVALQVGWLIGGTVIVENIFAWPGIGTLLVNSVEARDVTVIQAIIMVIAVTFILLNLLADLVVIGLDPRIGRE